MSLWKFRNAEFELDITDADFLDKVEEAGKFAEVEQSKVEKVGKTSDLIREKCAIFYQYFDIVLGEGAGEKLFESRSSIAICNEAVDSFIDFMTADMKQTKEKANVLMNKYKPNKPQQKQYYYTKKKH